MTPERFVLQLCLVSLFTSGLYGLMKLWFHYNSIHPFSRMFVWWLLVLRFLLPFGLSLPGWDFRVSLPDPPLSEIGNLTSNSASDIPGTQAPFFTNLVVSRTLSFLDVIFWVWLIGALLMVGYQVFGYHYQRHRLLQNSKSASDATLTVFSELCDTYGFRRNRSVLVSSSAPMPLLIGYFRPRVLLPHEEYSREELHLILQHELTHAHRHDLWLKLAFLLAHAVHWFNPVLFWLQRDLTDDMELACDAAVLRGKDPEYGGRYSRAILSAMQPVSVHLSGLTTGFHGGALTMKKRVNAIMMPPPMRKGRPILVITVALFLLVGVLVGCVGDAFPLAQDGLYDFGSFSDFFQVRGQNVSARYFSDDMTLDDFLERFNLTAEEANPNHGSDSPIQSYRTRNTILFDETGDLPWSLSINTLEDGRLRNLSLTGSFWGVPYEDAMAQTEEILSKIEDACGKGISYEEWMESNNYDGMVIYPYGDSLESLSEPDHHYTCEYLFLKTNDVVHIKVSHHTINYDTTEQYGEAYDALFEITIGTVINRE